MAHISKNQTYIVPSLEASNPIINKDNAPVKDIKTPYKLAAISP